MAEGRIYPRPSEGQAQQQYGERRPRIARRYFPLDEARDNKRIELGGNAIWCVLASSYTARLDIAIHEEGQGLIPFQKGTFVRTGPFSQLYLTNASQSGEWVELIVIREEKGQFEIENPGSTFETVQLVAPTEINGFTDKTISAGTNGTVKPFNSGRREIIIRSLSSNTNTARIANGSVGATKGVPLEPGQSITLTTVSAVSAYNMDDTGDGSDIVLAGIELED